VTSHEDCVKEMELQLASRTGNNWIKSMRARTRCVVVYRIYFNKKYCYPWN